MHFYRITRKERAYDEATAFVVRARDDYEARQIVFRDQKAIKEDYGDHGLEPELWLDHTRSTCDYISVDGPEEIILVDFLHA